MNFYHLRMIYVFLCLIIAVVPFFVPPWGAETKFMAIDKVFDAFSPGQYITTPFFLILAVYFIVSTISKYLTEAEIKKMRAQAKVTGQHFIK